MNTSILLNHIFRRRTTNAAGNHMMSGTVLGLSLFSGFTNVSTVPAKSLLNA
ncbi:hypothetical protein [Segetibacter sp.]|jgi:hypothetical protein|uniref:hypothetical protein n=1 Tax=Segetibacter sp. TaxID=2231182 RepID=UPI002614D9DD|nr:hypothetical protein [Segetibacter sp.]